MDEDMTHSPDPSSRGGVEEPLSNRPKIIRFTAGNAGAVYASTHNENQVYRRSLSDVAWRAGTPIQYEPFSSKLDWEIARWAKMRGPGSNALTELLNIEGVSHLQQRQTHRGIPRHDGHHDAKRKIPHIASSVRGIEFALAPAGEPFYLVLDDDWYRELAAHQVKL